MPEQEFSVSLNERAIAAIQLHAMMASNLGLLLILGPNFLDNRRGLISIYYTYKA